ncbi:MAG TPA: cysteine desulfurase family protein [bacterium]|nr:cysteine desulfurase family protein [bacterium]
MSKLRNVYLDFAATSPLDERALDLALPYLREDFGNANSLHTFGRRAQSALEDGRKKIAEFLDLESSNIYFTSGATEANNWVLHGVYKMMRQARPNQVLHFVISAFEHPSIMEAARHFLAKQPQVEITYVQPTAEGIIEASAVEAALRDETVLVSVMFANNEVGTIQPIKEIGEVVAQRKAKGQQIYFHSDASQAALYLPLNIKDNHLDFTTVSGHKLYGPKGIGVLAVNGKTVPANLMFGGHQERGKRPGTSNVFASVAMGEACRVARAEREANYNAAKELQDHLLKLLENNLNNYRVHGSLSARLPNNLNLGIEGVEGESLLFILDDAGIAVSTGSACASGSLHGSPVLAAMGIPPEKTHGSLRISWGRGVSKDDLDYFVSVLAPAVERLRVISPLK